MNEKDFLQAVRDLAVLCGWIVYHPFDSRRSTPGFPDLCLVRAPRLIFAELKSETGRVTGVQQEWLDALRGTAAEVYVWRPSDIQRVGVILSPRFRDDITGAAI